MVGAVNIKIKNRHISYDFTLDRNVTIITGDSGTGKTKLLNMIREYSELGKESGVTINCKYPCIILSGINWESILKKTKNSIVFVEESTTFLSSMEFAKNIKSADNYYVLVSREPLNQLAYSVDSIHQIIKNRKKSKLVKIYKDISITDIEGFPYDCVITEDSNAGYELYNIATGDVSCLSSGGKSGLLKCLEDSDYGKVLVIADAAALGPEIGDLLYYKNKTGKNIDFFLPECFEWLILKSSIFKGYSEVSEIMRSTIDYIDSSKYFSWEQFFYKKLVDITKDNKELRYNKKKLAKGYKSPANINAIINAMK